MGEVVRSSSKSSDPIAIEGQESTPDALQGTCPNLEVERGAFNFILRWRKPEEGFVMTENGPEKRKSERFVILGFSDEGLSEIGSEKLWDGDVTLLPDLVEYAHVPGLSLASDPVSFPARLFFRRQSHWSEEKGQSVETTMIIGAGLGTIMAGLDDERWKGEIIISPIRKYDTGKAFFAKHAEEVLTNPAFAHPEGRFPLVAGEPPIIPS